MLTGHRSGLSGSQKDGEKDKSLNLVRETLKCFLVSLLFQWNKRFFVSPIKSELLLWRHRALVSGSTPACLTWRISSFFFAAGFLSSLRATAHPRTSRLWIRNLWDCCEWKREGLRDTADTAMKMLLVYDSNYTPTVGYSSVNRFVCPGL